MSVTQPADSGGGGGKTQNEQNLQVYEKMIDENEIGSWAKMMEEEEEIDEAADDDENEGVDEVDGVESSRSPDRKRRIPNDPPFKAQVTNISSSHIEEDLLYYFGGEEMIKNISFRLASGKADIEFLSKKGLVFALEKHDKNFQGKQLKVFVIQQREIISGRPSRYNEDRQYGGNHDSRSFNNRRDSYRANQYNSQTSLNSDRNSKYNNDKGYQNYNQNQYGTLPAGGFHDKKGYNNRGYQHLNTGVNTRNSFRQRDKHNNFERQYSNPQYGLRNEDNGGPLQRSGSYQHNRQDNFGRYGGNISSRSRTESHSTILDSVSRASSKMSIMDDHPKPVVKKPSANPFGDAKPVDTQTKLLEIENRLIEKKKQEKEMRQSQLALQNSVIDENEEKKAYPKHQNKHNSGKTHQKSEHHGSDNRFDVDSEHEQQRRNSFEHGAPPGSVLIKKRESVDIEKQREEECSTPPVDPIQYPPNRVEQKKDSTASDKSFTHSLPPQHPSNTYQRTKNRASQKNFNSRGHTLQKSATMGQILHGSKQNEHEHNKMRRESIGDRKEARGGHRNDGTRRSSFSGSESGINKRGRGGINSGARGNMRGSGGRGGGRKSDNGEHRNKKISEGAKEEIEKIEEIPAEKIEKKEDVANISEQQKPLKEENNEVKIEENKVEAVVVVQQSTPKKKDKKKEKKKEAKTNIYNSNKFAALIDCPQ